MDDLDISIEDLAGVLQERFDNLNSRLAALEGKDAEETGYPDDQTVADMDEVRAAIQQGSIAPGRPHHIEDTGEDIMDMDLDAILTGLQHFEDTPDWARMSTSEKTVAIKISEMCRLAQQEIERLRELLEEAAEELTTIFDMAYPDRTDYPDEMRRWKRDMDLVYRIKDAIRNQDTAK